MDDKVWAALTAAVIALFGMIVRMGLKFEARVDKADAAKDAAFAEALKTMREMQKDALEKNAQQYREQLEIALNDARDFKDMLRESIQAGKGAVEVGVGLRKRQHGGGDR